MQTIKKKDFEKLYKIACSDWKTKFDTKFKNSLFSETLDFEDDFILEMKKACTADQLPVFEKIFKDVEDDLFSGIIDYKSFCKKAGVDEITVTLSGCDYNSKKLEAFFKIQQIEKYFNKDWVPNWNNSDEYKHYPYFEKTASGWRFFFSSYYCYFGGVVAFYKSRKISDFVGKTFKDIYIDLLS